MISCLRCGKCCIIFNDRLKRWVHCKFLDLTRSCTIYNHRLDTPLGFGFYCTEIKKTSFNYPGCPYNTTKPTHPAYK